MRQAKARAIEFTPEEIASDPILVGMVRDKIALTCENYIERCYPDQPSEDWMLSWSRSCPSDFRTGPNSGYNRAKQCDRQAAVLDCRQTASD